MDAVALGPIKATTAPARSKPQTEAAAITAAPVNATFNTVQVKRVTRAVRTCFSAVERPGRLRAPRVNSPLAVRARKAAAKTIATVMAALTASCTVVRPARWSTSSCRHPGQTFAGGRW